MTMTSEASNVSTRPLIVLGMHRSGTSLATAMLESAGLDVGDRLNEGNWSNPRGHFEDMDFVDLHRAALIQLGFHEAGWLTSALPELSKDLVDSARTLVDYKQASGRPWGWKDPRTVLFLPLWSSLLPDARFVIVYRAPWEVLDSLYRRGDAAFKNDPDLAVRVWVHYNRTLLNFALSAPERCVFANMETIAADPAAWVAAVAHGARVPLRPPNPAICNRGLLHGERARDRAGLLFRHYPEVVELFAALERHSVRPAGMKPSTPWVTGSTIETERRLAMFGWQAHSAAMGEADRSRHGPGNKKTMTSPEATNPGWCPCCRTESRFVETGAWLRDQYLCEHCQSIPRCRAVNLTLDTYFAGWEHASIHEFSPTNDFIRRHCQGYSCSSSLDGVLPGAERDGVRVEAIEQLSFADDTFDVFVTQDVLEHLFQPERAVREIMRVVKPGGAHVFTTLKHKGLRRTRQRARVENEVVVHRLPPQYQGDSRHDRHALLTWEYGDDFELRLWNWCGYPTVSYVVRDRSAGLDGEFLDVFVTRKLFK